MFFGETNKPYKNIIVIKLDDDCEQCVHTPQVSSVVYVQTLKPVVQTEEMSRRDWNRHDLFFTQSKL